MERKKSDMNKRSFEELYQKHLEILNENPAVLHEPSSEGIHLGTFFEAIAGMGERARLHGTIALSVRNR